MTREDLLVARLIVWEGSVPGERFRSHIKAHTDALKDSINYTMRNTKWRYQIWKTRPVADGVKHQLEVSLFAKSHPKSGADYF